jgi:transglutaminase-like putative cysteine protease
LLRKASFDAYEPVGYRAPRWTTSDADFADVAAGTEVGTWPLLAGVETGLVAEVSLFLPVGTGILPVPHGAAVLEDLLAAAVETNRYGTVRAREGQPLVRYAVRYGGAASVDAPPTARDVAVPDLERPALAQIAGQLGLAGEAPGVVLERVARFFHDQFTYRQYLRGVRYDPTGNNTPVRQFLLRDRAGHCEFFATATTLLLRTACLPARYAVGYSVPDDGRGGTQLVRARHAHAWVLVYVNGAWRDFDTTPASWEEIEEAARPPLQGLSDAFGWVRYAFARWRYYTDQGLLARIVLWLAPVAVGWVAWRIFARRRRATPGPESAGAAAARPARGTDSEFYRIEDYLTRAGRGRRPTETVGDWLRREQLADSLQAVVALHYAYRFDPCGVTPEQRHELQARVAAWLAAPPASGRMPAG